MDVRNPAFIMEILESPRGLHKVDMLLRFSLQTHVESQWAEDFSTENAGFLLNVYPVIDLKLYGIVSNLDGQAKF